MFFTGYAKLPSGITASDIYRVVGIGVEVEAETGRVLAADCTLATEVGRNFFRRLVVGRDLEESFQQLLAAVERRYHGSAQKAIITALKIIREKYKAHKEKEKRK